MADINPNVIMGGYQPDTAKPINNYAHQQLQNQQQQNSNAMATEQTLRAHYEAMDAREKSRLSSTVIGASQLKPFLDNNDVEGATDFLMRRRNALHQRIGLGENIDTQETDYALQALREGKLDELKNNVNGLMSAGQVYGIINPTLTAGGDTGVLVNRMIQEGSAVSVQDALQQIKGGAGQAGKNAANISTGRAANYETQTGNNKSDLDYKPRISFNDAQSKAAGDQIVKNDTALGNLNNLQQAISAAKTTLPKVMSTGPVFGRVGAAAKDPDYINLQRDLNEITLLAKDLYNLGSGQGFTDADRDFLKELSGGAYNRDESIQYALDRFDASLATRKKFLQDQNQQYQQQYGGNSQPVQDIQPQGSKITVTNGKETYMIDPNDLSAAAQEGFKQVQ